MPELLIGEMIPRTPPYQEGKRVSFDNSVNTTKSALSKLKANDYEDDYIE